MIYRIFAVSQMILFRGIQIFRPFLADPIVTIVVQKNAISPNLKKDRILGVEIKNIRHGFLTPTPKKKLLGHGMNN